jgi:hypothetical protein
VTDQFASGGIESRDTFLTLLGYTDVQYRGEEVTTCTPNTVRATVLTKAAIPDGRVACYMLVGRNAKTYSDGSTVLVDTDVLNSTINIQLLE